MTAPESVESEVLAVERQWVQAHRDLDLVAIESILDDDYRQIRPDGTVIDKQQALAGYAARDQAWEIARSDEYELRLYGGTALLIGRWAGRGVNAGERFDYQARFGALYIRRESGWKLVFDQSTSLS